MDGVVLFVGFSVNVRVSLFSLEISADTLIMSH